MTALRFARTSTLEGEFCPHCEQRLHQDHASLIDRPLLGALYRWDLAIDNAIERITDWLAFRGEIGHRCFCDQISAGRGFGMSGDLCDCCHLIHAS